MNNTYKKLFVNLSNHPYEKWGEQQKQKASDYGRVIDIPFPMISPAMPAHEVVALATKYAYDILSLANGAEVSVHVMGEMCFTFSFVSIMSTRGVRCYASTTERIVTEKENGIKETLFQFVSFRQYKTL